MTTPLNYMSTYSMEQTLAVANSPVFLVVRIKRDPGVVELGRKAAPNDIFTELKKCVAADSISLKQRAKKYVLLGALAIQNQHDFLARATRLRSNKDDWFEVVAKMLLSSTIQNSHLETVPGIIRGPTMLNSPIQNSQQSIVITS